MKASWRALPFALGVLASPVGLRAQPTGAPPPPAAALDPADDLRQQMTQLVLADAS